MHRSKKCALLIVVVFALSAISAASVSAAPAQFTASATGTLTGKALTEQVFTVTGGPIKCTAAAATGTIAKTSSPEQHMTVNYSGCTAFGFATHISPATYLLTANGEVHIKETITINVTGGCHITIGPQTLKTVGYETNVSKLKVIPNLTAVAYASTGGICGASGVNGTLTGTTELERVGGGSLTYDKETAEPSPRFTYSATGNLSGKATATQTWTTSAGQMKCTTAATSGSITSTNSTEQHFTISYSGCTAFGLAGVHFSPATYVYTANGEIHLISNFIITVTLGGCTVTFGPQTLKSVSYTNNAGKLKVTPSLTNMKYTSTGGLCGASGTNGTFTGPTEIERVGGGSFTHDP